MPCSTCNCPLAYHDSKQLLYCPRCLDLPVADKNLIEEKASYIREQYLNQPELIQILEEFGTVRVIAKLVTELNEGAAGIAQENRMQFRQFFHPTPLIMNVYKNVDAFEDHFDPNDADAQEEVHERVDTLLDADTVLIPILKQIQEDFTIPLEFTPGIGNWRDFYSNHSFQKSEYWLCSERCMRANVGAREEFRDAFLDQQEIFRSFTSPDRGDVETIRDFGSFWYGLIVSLGFAATLDTTIKDVYTTDFPEYVTIFDIEDLLDEVDSVVADQLQARGNGDLRPGSLDENDFDACGKSVFGDRWGGVKEHILVSEANLDAHPLFFKISGTQEVKLPKWRESRRMPFTRIVYPDQFSFLLKFQLFPLLKNGDADHSRDILADLTGERGLEFERNVYEYLDRKTSNSYHSCKTSKQNGNEIDVIFTHDGTVYFVEVKFVLPTLNMMSQRGIQSVNSTFDEKIFNQGAESGKPFPEKVSAWLNLDAGTEITYQNSPDRTDRVREKLNHAFSNLDTEMLVVSNFVPSYLEKRGVRFITDLELYQWIENGDDVFYDVLH